MQTPLIVRLKTMLAGVRQLTHEKADAERNYENKPGSTPEWRMKKKAAESLLTELDNYWSASPAVYKPPRAQQWAPFSFRTGTSSGHWHSV